MRVSSGSTPSSGSARTRRVDLVARSLAIGALISATVAGATLVLAGPQATHAATAKAAPTLSFSSLPLLTQPRVENFGWLDRELGSAAPAAPLTRRIDAKTTVALGAADGVRVTRKGNGVTLTTRGIERAGEWKRFDGGIERTTDFGRETITASPLKTELYAVVTKRQGRRTWSWSLGTTLNPRLTPTGAVTLGSELSISPVAIFDHARRDITPDGLRWHLAGGELRLTLDDASLPLPYAIDPLIASSKPDPLAEAIGAEASLVDYYRLNEPSGTTATNWRAGGANGTYEGTIALAQTGLINSDDTAATFNGTNVRIAAGSRSRPLTVEAWVSTTDAVNQLPIWSNRPGTGSLYFGITGGRVFSYVPGGAFVVNSSGTNPPISDGAPHHVVYTSDGADTKLFVDGILRAKGAETSAVPGATAAYVGFDAEGNQWWPGKLDEVATYSAALTCTGATNPGDACTGGTIKTHYDLGRTFGLTFSATTSTIEKPLTTASDARRELWFKPSGSGSFTVTSNATDAVDNIQKVNFGALSGATGGGDDTTAPYQGTYTLSSVPNAIQTVNVTITNDDAGHQAATGVFRLIPDATAPAGGSIDYTGGYDADGSVTVTTTPATDADSGMAANTIQRQVVALANDTCTFPDTFVTGVSNVTSPNTVASGNCARYRLRPTDNVGNVGTVNPTGSPVVKVDTTAPVNAITVVPGTGSTPVFSGTTLFYRGSASGTFQLRNTLTEANPKETVFGGTGAQTGWTAHGSAETISGSSPYTSTNYSWSGAGSTADFTVNVTGNDFAGNSDLDALTFRNDSTAPTGSITAPGALANVGGSSITVASSDAADNSGLPLGQARFFFCAGAACNPFAGTLIATDPTPPFSVTWNASALPDGIYQLGVELTDAVGNTFNSASRQVNVDNTRPTQALTLNVASGGASLNTGTSTLYYKGDAAGSFTIVSTVTDTTGALHTDFGALTGGTGFSFTPSTDTTPSGGPFESNAISWTTATGAPTQTIVSGDLAGNDSLPANLTYASDTTAPTGHSAALSGDVNGGFYSAASVALTLSNGTDGGAGINAASRVVERDQSTLTNGTCAAFPNTFGTTISAAELADGDDDTVTTGNCYQYRVRVADRVGNLSTNSVPSAAAKVDTATPAAPTLAFDNFVNASRTGTTIFVKGSGSSFRVAATPSASAAGTLRVTFPTFSGWTNPAPNPDTTDPYQGTYTSDGSTPSGNQNVVARTNANTDSAAGTFTVSTDSSAPTPTAAQCGASPCSDTAWYGSAQTVTLAATDPGGSGGVQLYYTNDGTAPTTSSTLYAGPFSVASTTTLRWIAVDAVGNATAVQTNVIQIDTTAPAAPTLSFSGLTNASVVGTTVYVNTSVAAGGGGFTVTAAATDVPSGIKHVTFPAAPAGWTPLAAVNDTTSAYSQAYTFPASATIPGSALNVTATNNADLTSAAAPFTVVADTGGPTITTTCNGVACSTSTYTSTVDVDASATDGGSGGATLRYTTDGTTPTDASPLFPAAGVPVSTTTTFKLRAKDAVGNVTSQTLTVNANVTLPTLTSSALSSGNTIALTFSTSLVNPPPATTAFTVTVDGVTRTVTNVTISGAVVTLTFDGAAATSTNAVRFSYTKPLLNPLADASGNEAASIASTLVGGTGGPAPVVSGPSSSDAPASTVSFTSGPQARTTATSASFTFTSPNAGSFECSLDGGAFVGCASPYSTSGLSDGSHRFEVRLVRLNGPREKSIGITWTVDNTGPVAPTKIEGPAAITIDAGPTFSFSSSEPGATFLCRVDGGALSGCQSPKSLAGLAYGAHTFEVRAVDTLGNSGAGSTWTFQVVAPVTGGSVTSVAEELAIRDQGGQVFSTDRSASLTWPAMPYDGLLMTIAEPSAPVQPAPGLTSDSVVDANAIRVSTGERVTDFGGAMLRIVLGPATVPVAIYTSSDDGRTWELVPYFEGTPLPAGQRHGVRIEGGQVVVYTLHLSLWATVRDAQAPTTPVLTGTVAADGVTLAWQPSQDNVGVARYVLLVDSRAVAVYDAATRQAKIGALAVDDARSFQLAAEDAAGNRSPVSAALRAVPSLIGLPLDQARAALVARGLLLGTVTEQDSSRPAGSVIAQAPATPALSAQGQPVNLVIARSTTSGSARFVLKVAAAQTVPLKVRHTINVRLQVTRRANIAAVLRSPANARLFTWKRQVRAGVTILHLRLPTAVKRSGVYTLAVWAAGVGEKQRVVKRLRIKIVGADAATLGPQASPPRSSVEIVLAGGTGSSLHLNGSFRVTRARTAQAVFDRASTRRPVHALVVDVATEGLSLVRDFHLVFPDVPILAVVPRQALSSLARWAGADIVLVNGASIDHAVRRLLG